MDRIKKMLSALLVICLVLTLIPAGAVAVSSQGTMEQGGYMEAEQDVYASEITVGNGPTLAEGNHVRWIDRLADLPTYATDFYQWLEKNAATDGALVDPTKGSLRDGKYVYYLATVPGTVEFTYGTDEDPEAKALEAIRAHANQQFSVVMDYAVEVYSAFDRDHAEVFWLSGRSSYTWTLTYHEDHENGAGTGSYSMKVMFYLKNDTFDVRHTQYQDVAVITDAMAQMQTDVDEILAQCPTDSSVPEQIRYLNRVLTETNVYNTSASTAVSLDPWNCVSALSGGACGQAPVCEGYSRAFKVLCDRLGIGCVLVEGDAKSSASATPSAHMWNYVQVGSDWYAVDVTWNDPLTTGGDDAVLSGYETEDWLLLGSESVVSEGLTFIESHPVTNVATNGGIDFANGPILAAQAYVQPDNYMDIAPYRSGEFYTAPEKEGYVFAGWFTDDTFQTPVEMDVTTGWAYAKFLDAQTLTVKFQLTAGTTAQSGYTDLRMLTAVGDLQLRGVSFRINLDGVSRYPSSNTVYEQVRAGDTIIDSPSAVFGEDARYFVTYTLTGVPQSAFDMEFVITPRWQTLDGTKVSGTTRSIRISDGL